MEKRRNRYREMERCVTFALITASLFFIVFLIASGIGILWLKTITAILSIFVSGLCLTLLFLNRELLRQRSLWMSVSAAALVICILFSLILNFPSPNPYKQSPRTETHNSSSSAYVDSEAHD